MKIIETNLNPKLNSIKKKKTNSGSGFDSLIGAEEVEVNSEISSVGSVSNSIINFDALNFITSLNDKEFIKKQNIDWAKDALEKLESLRKSIVFGSLSLNTLQNLEEKLDILPYDTEDTELKSIIDDIKVRISVETEKIKRFYGEKKQ